MGKEVFYVKDIAVMFDVTRQCVNKWHRTGMLKYNELPTGRRYCTREQIDEFKNRRSK